MLKSIDPGTGKEKVWNPQLYSGDKRNIMPIITPAYPSMCATYNISKSGKSIILKELERGNDIVQKIFENKLQWKDLFQRHTFFTADHKYYLNVVVSSSNKEAKKSWSGLVESKVRILVMKLEEQADMIELARPFTKATSGCTRPTLLPRQKRSRKQQKTGAPSGTCCGLNRSSNEWVITRVESDHNARLSIAALDVSHLNDASSACAGCKCTGIG